MPSAQIDSIPIAVRVYPDGTDTKEPATNKRWRRPEGMLVFDTETRTDSAQNLLFGSFRYIVNGECLREALFHADDLPARDRKFLQRYVAPSARGNGGLILLTRKAFL